MKFIIFHGSFGSPEENWFPMLKEKLESLGQKVFIPQFPVENWDTVTKGGQSFKCKNQTLESWFAVFERVIKSFTGNEKLCFIGHSLGCVFILHLIERYKIPLDCAVFVSPFLTRLERLWQIDLVNQTFYKKDFNYPLLKKYIPTSYVLYSASDPYVDEHHPMEFARKLGSSRIEVMQAGHFNSEVNLNEFPLVLELCKSRLDLSLYQRYLDHRRELFAVDYTKGKTEEVIYIKPEEVFDEGIFHFRNLQKGGFCTFYTGLKFWDTQNLYFQEARKAAKRLRNITRVFVVEKLADLERSRLLEQIRLDIKGGLTVYLCMLDDLKGQIGELDFGIWDDDYLCIVSFDRNKKVNEIKLSSRKKDIQKGMQWKEYILDKAVRIRSTEKDVQSFVFQHKKT